MSKATSSLPASIFRPNGPATRGTAWQYGRAFSPAESASTDKWRRCGTDGGGHCMVRRRPPPVASPAMTPSRDIARLLEIMAALRTPGTGCPWDLQQTFETIAPYTIEEAYEIADAIARGDLDDLREELGDLLLQVVFHARMAQEQGAFDFADVVESLTAKLVRRHPHVFGDARGLTPKAVEGLWERIKSAERAGKGGSASGGETALAGVPVGLPALTRALKLQAKA